MRGKRRRTVGLSIGSRNIALAEVNVNAAGSIEVYQVGIVDTPAEAVINGRIIRPSAVSRAVRELLAVSHIDGSQEVSLAIADEGSITGLQVLPSMSRTETLEALMGEVENYAALAGSEPALDFQTTNGTTGGVGQQMEVLFVTTQRDLVDSYLPVVEAANLKLVAMETRSLAILRALTSFAGQSEDDNAMDAKPLMLVTVEENAGIIIVVRNRAIQFIHNIEIGSSDLQTERDFRELARELGSSVDYYHNTFPMEGKLEAITLFTDEPDLADIRGKVGAFLGLPLTTPYTPRTVRESDGEEAIE